MRVIYLKCIALNSLRLFISGTLTVEQIYQDRDKFATLVREVAAPDVGRMGIEILSFTIKVWLSEFFSIYVLNKPHSFDFFFFFYTV